MLFIKLLLIALIGFGSGVVISGGVFAFIAILGVVPRMAQKTKTEKYIVLYENCILYGGIYGAIDLITPIKLNLSLFGLIIIGFLTGIFIGSIAVSIAEVLNVIPVLTKRINLKKGLVFLMLAVAAGKTIGSLLYYLLPGFAVHN